MEFKRKFISHMQESFGDLLIMLVASLVIALIYSYFELKMQNSTVSYMKLFKINVYCVTVVCLIINTAYFLMGWYSALMEGNTFLFIFLGITGIGIVSYLKYDLHTALGYACNYPKLMMVLPVALLSLPLLYFLFLFYLMSK